MNDEGTSADRTIRAFLRGEGSWEALESVGVTIDFPDESPRLSGMATVTVTASLEEIAMGFLTLKDRFQDLRVWATVVLHSDLIDLEERFETDPRADVLLGGIWDAAFGERPEPLVGSIARELAWSPPG
jgi:hypothetical protein